MPRLPHAGVGGRSSVRVLHPRCQLPTLLGFAAGEDPRRCPRAATADRTGQGAQSAAPAGLQPPTIARGLSMQARLLYVMDPMCSWCWGFAPVLESLAEQAAAAGVGLRSEERRVG